MHLTYYSFVTYVESLHKNHSIIYHLRPKVDDIELIEAFVYKFILLFMLYVNCAVFNLLRTDYRCECTWWIFSSKAQ